MTTQDDPVYRLELPVAEVRGLFLLLEKPVPPFIADAAHANPVEQRAALRSLMERGLVKLEGKNAQMAQGAARFVEALSQSPMTARVHRARRDQEMVVWYSPAGPRTVRTEITPEGSCRWLDVPTAKLATALAVDCGLAGGRAATPRLDATVPVDRYGGLLFEMERGAEEGRAALMAVGVDESTSDQLAAAMGSSVTAFTLSTARLADKGRSSLEITSVAWLDAGPMGAIRVTGPDLAALRAGLSGEESVRLESVSDQEMLDAILGLLSDEGEG